jgi:hypothetical protein
LQHPFRGVAVDAGIHHADVRAFARNIASSCAG